jgi:hypothetical protein
MTAWLLPLDSNQPSPVNSRQPSPRWLDRNGIGGERENRTHPTAILQGSPAYPERSPELVLGACNDQASSALQADVSTTITNRAWCGDEETTGIEPIPERWQRST